MITLTLAMLQLTVYAKTKDSWRFGNGADREVWVMTLAFTTAFTAVSLLKLYGVLA